MLAGISASSCFLGRQSMGYEYYNPNPFGRAVGDCAIRAISKALGQTWEETYIGLALEGFQRGDLPNADDVWGPYLRERGFSRNWIPDDGAQCCTVAQFAQENPKGVFVLSMPGRHVVAVIDGVVYDSWDSQNEVPTYFWTKES